MTSAIILAAGSSRRLGQPKQNIRIGDETLLERSVRIAHLAGLLPIFVILPPQSPGSPSIRRLTANGWDSTAGSGTTDIEAGIGGVEVLINHEAAEGMASSIRLGVRASIGASATGAVVLACDQIAVTSEHLRALTQTEAEVRASNYAGRNGIPAYFPAPSFERLLQLTGDTGARDLLRHAVTVPLLNGDLDIDTPTDLALARQLFPDIASSQAATGT